MAFKIHNSIFSAIILYIDYYITTLYIEAVIRLWNRLRFDIKKYQKHRKCFVGKMFKERTLWTSSCSWTRQNMLTAGVHKKEKLESAQ